MAAAGFLALLLIPLMARGTAAARGEQSGEQLDRPLFRLALQWLPQSQFAGYYLARDQGFFEREGLSVVLRHTGPGPSSLDLLREGQADLATLFLSDGIREAAGPQPVVLVAQVVQTSNLLLLAWKDRGVLRPADLDGKRLSTWPGTFSLAFDLFFRLQGVVPNRIPQHTSVRLFLSRGVDACAAMSYNELHRLYQAGVDHDQLTVFSMADYGLGYPEDGVYTTPAFFSAHKARMPAFRRALLAGWRYAQKNREEAVACVLRECQNAGVPVNGAHARWMLEGMLRAIFPPPKEAVVPGVLGREAFLRCARDLKREGLIGHLPEWSTFAPLQEAP